jgi:thymidylate kinase
MHPKKTFLTDFFENLNLGEIKYCVLRNYQSLPFSCDGSDLDILINKKDSSVFFNLIKEIADNHNGKIISIIDSSICPRLCVLGNKEGGWGIMIDLHYDLISYRGYTIFSNKNVWSNTFKYNGQIAALNKIADGLVGLFKELLNNGSCDEKYFNDFKNSSIDKVFLNEVFQDIQKPELIPILLDIKNQSYSKNEIKRLVKVLNRYFPRKRKESLKKYSKFSRLFKQPGFAIAFLGADGSGKSTIIERIKPALNDAFHNAVYYEHMRPNKLPSIARLMGNKEEFNGPVSNPHGSSSSGFFGSLLRWSYYMLDYTFGFYLKIWPKKAIRSCVWIFDRYYYDYLIDPKRGRIKLHRWILKVGQFIVPQPDLILCLGADAASIHKRKPELTLKEVERQVLELRTFCDSHKNAVWIDTGKSIDESSNDTLDTIIVMMAQRFESFKLKE